MEAGVPKQYSGEAILGSVCETMYRIFLFDDLFRDNGIA
jgi:hypothetical protein